MSDGLKQYEQLHVDRTRNGFAVGVTLRNTLGYVNHDWCFESAESLAEWMKKWGKIHEAPEKPKTCECGK